MTNNFTITEITNSSNVLAIGYDDATNTGYVKFKGGAEYIINELPLFVYDEWAKAESKGSYFATQIKKQYTVVKIEKDEERS